MVFNTFCEEMSNGFILSIAIILLEDQVCKREELTQLESDY